MLLLKARGCARSFRGRAGHITADWPTGRLADWHILLTGTFQSTGRGSWAGCIMQMAAWLHGCMAAWLHGVMASIMDPWNMA
jgi:hypothetical protein